MKKFFTYLSVLFAVSGATAQSLDTTGLHKWNSLVNSYENWETGAFNQTKNTMDPFDFGWGSYDMTTHFINADSMYVIQTVGGDFKKFSVDKLASGVWHFRVADIDGTNEVTKQVNRNIVTDKNFFYYSIDNDQTLDLEGDNTKWDIVFTKYTADLGFAFYPVAGVLHNRNIRVSEVHHAVGGSASINDTTSFPTSTNISTIGYDWKDAFAGIVHDTVVFYVGNDGGTFHELKFTSYGGSATGNMGFEVDGVAQNISLSAGNVNQVYYDLDTKSEVHTNTNNDWDVAFWAVPGTTDAPVRINDVGGVKLYVYPKADISSWSGSVGVEENASTTALVSAYPNPTSDILNVAVLHDNNEKVTISLIDLNGRVVETQNYSGNGMNTYQIDVNNQPAGMYVLSLETETKKSVQRIIIK